MSMRRFKNSASIMAILLATGIASSGAQASWFGSDEPKSDSQTPAAATMETAVHQAQLQRNDGDLQGAARTLAQLVLAYPDNPQVLGEYGKTLAAEGSSDDALLYLKRAIEFSPNDWTLLSAEGVAYDQKGNYAAAKAAYDRALVVQPGEPSVLSNAAMSRMLAGDLDGSEQLLAQVPGGAKENPKIEANIALLQSLRASHPSARTAAVAPKPVSQSIAVAQREPAPVSVQPAPAPMQQPQQAAPQPAHAMPTPTLVAAATPAPAPAKTYEALKNDPLVVMAPLPQSEETAKPVAVAHSAPAPRVALAKAAAQAATAAPKPLVAPGAMQVAKTTEAAKPVATLAAAPLKTAVTIPVEKPEAAATAKPPAPLPVKAAQQQPKPAPAPVKAAQQLAPKSTPVQTAAVKPAAPQTKPAPPAPVQTAAAKPAAPVAKPALPAPTQTAQVISVKAAPPQRTAALDTAVLRPTVTDVTTVAATAHKNAPAGGAPKH